MFARASEGCDAFSAISRNLDKPEEILQNHLYASYFQTVHIVRIDIMSQNLNRGHGC